ncbi:MAG: type II toxin-antitoxin system Phd/YefM family antitoxin [Actinobacteria bacterium]|nr:type II toxin-antitoxin system Phd/YefM family antitoxin [Actinomycetota bacterium]
MSISFTDDFKSVSDLKKKTNEIFKQIHCTGHPIIVTVNGKPNAVLLEFAI